MIWRAAIACLLLLFTCIYRFNTLGGAFGGFDNDHFVPFAYAKQVQAGEQPLRDFTGLGLQGARPSLTYEVSALGQRWLGNNLRSEALVTIAAIGLAASVAFLAASLLSNVGWASLATLVSIVVAPTLYNYPKVLVLAASALVIALYTQRPAIGAVVGAAVLTAVAFLFRHDYAVYVGVGVLLACVATGDWRRAARHSVAFVLMTLALLTPSLAYVQRHVGLIEYFRDGFALSRLEASRTDILEWPRFGLTGESIEVMDVVAFFGHEQNAVAWLYYLTRLLPLMVAIAVWKGGEARRPGNRAAGLAIAGMSAFALPLLVRGNVAVRLGDIGPLLAVMFAVVAYEAVRRRAGDTLWWRAARIVLVIVVLAGTALSARTVGFIDSQLRTAGLAESGAMTFLRAQRVWNQLVALPEASLSDASAAGPLGIARYLHKCTAPSDRIVLMTYEPELLPLAGRLFGAGRLSVIPGYALAEHQQRELVARWSRQSVPLTLVEFQEFDNPSSPVAPIVRSYLLEHYRLSGTTHVSADRVLRVFLHRDRAPVSTLGSDRLPCLK